MSDLIPIERDSPPSDRQRIRVLEAGHLVLIEQLADVAVTMQDVKDCLQKGDRRMGSLETELRDNSAVTAEVRDILSVAKVGLRVLGGVGVLVRWAGYLAAAGASLYAAWHMIKHGGKPPGVG